MTNEELHKAIVAELNERRAELKALAPKRKPWACVSISLRSDPGIEFMYRANRKPEPFFLFANTRGLPTYVNESEFVRAI